MSEKCKWLHEILYNLPLVRYPFRLEKLPRNGIYFFYEDGEFWGHGGRLLRIVRIGTHRGINNFRDRIAEHYLFNQKRMEFDRNKPKPSDRSIFRKNIGRALLNKENSPYLETWNINFTKRINREKYGYLRDIEKEKALEKEITRLLREKFSFRFIIVEKKEERIGLEIKLIGTIARCEKCKPSENWLGKFSPNPKIRNSGLWLTQHLDAPQINEKEIKRIKNLVQKTKEWIEINW